MTSREDILAEIAREESLLARLHSEAEQCSNRLAELRSQLHQTPGLPNLQLSTASTHSDSIVPVTNAEKVTLFRSLFRGREDVFPRRWENTRNGKSGYSPACANEWKVGICAKKNVLGKARAKASCGECPHQAFLPVTDEEIERHLRGTHVMGVYPLLPDDECWFLAADFDKKSWCEDTAAFVETCRAHDVPVAVERSRSGQGAHVWFFFNEPVPAAVARRMGCFLLTQTMSRRHQLSMESYDRLFPNQDTLPKGGFGNLIALPLQRQARENGNSVFVDPSFRPYDNQWEFLANMEVMKAADVHSIADEALQRGQVVGVRASISDDDDPRPWELPPSGSVEKISITEPLPQSVAAVLSQSLFIEKAGLPSALLNQLKRLAAFQNPEFYKKQAMRLDNHVHPGRPRKGYQ